MLVWGELSGMSKGVLREGDPERTVRKQAQAHTEMAKKL